MIFEFNHERWVAKNKNENSHDILSGTIVLGFA
jgi:hypothetical protein